MNETHEQLVALIQRLNESKEWLAGVNWTKAECGDDELGQHITALENHLDNAIGRTARAIVRVKSISRS